MSEGFGSVNPAAVIFDMDGTLLSTETLCRRAWRQAALEIGEEMPDELYGKLLGRPNREAAVSLKEIWGESFRSEEYIRRTEALYRNIIESEGIALREGIIELLRLLSDKRIPLAVATSTHRELAQRKLSLCGLTNYFAVVVGGDEVKHGKPNPEIFLRTAERLDVPSNECIVFEDSDAGTLGARAAGMKCILIPDISWPQDEAIAAAWRVFDSHHRAISLFSDVTA